MAKKLNSNALNEKFNTEDSIENFSSKKEELSMEPLTELITKELSNILPVEDETEKAINKLTSMEVRSDDIVDQMITDMVAMDDEEKYVADTIKSMITDIADMTSSAKYLISSSPDPETMSAAAQLFNAAGSMLKELNKNRTEAKRNMMMIKLEKVKLLKSREQQRAKTASLVLGNGNTINIQNSTTNTIQYSQEDVIRRLIAEEDAEKNNIIDTNE